MQMKTLTELTEAPSSMVINERNQEGEGLTSLAPLPDNIQVFHLDTK
jgi:hypothetical protein